MVHHPFTKTTISNFDRVTVENLSKVFNQELLVLMYSLHLSCCLHWLVLVTLRPEKNYLRITCTFRQVKIYFYLRVDIQLPWAVACVEPLCDCVSLSVCLCLSFSVSVSLSVWLCLSLSVFVCHCQCVRPSLLICLSLSVCLCTLGLSCLCSLLIGRLICAWFENEAKLICLNGFKQLLTHQ